MSQYSSRRVMEVAIKGMGEKLQQGVHQRAGAASTRISTSHPAASPWPICRTVRAFCELMAQKTVGEVRKMRLARQFGCAELPHLGKQGVVPRRPAIAAECGHGEPRFRGACI